MKFSLKTVLLFIIATTILTTAIEVYSENLNSSCAIKALLNMQIDGGAVEFTKRAISVAESRSCVLILEIDSYGGYVAAADKIVENILQSGVACYTWIPPGGKATSAAAMVSLACRRIYMAPGSSIGAAIPMPRDEKTVNYVASRFRSLAERMFDGNETLISIAVSMVLNGTTLSYEDAINKGFADSAKDVIELEHIIGANIVENVEPNYWEQLVSLFSDPTIASLMLIAGAALIVLEILITGFQGYIVAGVLLIALALYSMTLIPPDLLALLFLLSGFILIVIEIHTPGFGVFGIAGAILTLLGLSMLYLSKPPETFSELNLVLTSGLMAFTGLTLFIVYKALRTVKIRKPSYVEELLNSVGIAKTRIEETVPGVVYVANEEWTAYSVKGSIEAGKRVRIVRVEGLKLYVEPVEE